MTIAWSQLHICKHTLASIYGDTVVVVVMQVANQSHQSVQVPCFRLVPEKKLARPRHQRKSFMKI